MGHLIKHTSMSGWITDQADYEELKASKYTGKTYAVWWQSGLWDYANEDFVSESPLDFEQRFMNFEDALSFISCVRESYVELVLNREDEDVLQANVEVDKWDCGQVESDCIVAGGTWVRDEKHSGIIHFSRWMQQ
jgi:hypothetical protein